jgi:hypothetical protein
MEHPGLETAIVAVGPAVLEEADEDLLDQILCCRSIAQRSREKVEQPSMVPLEEQTEPAQFSPPTANMSASSVTVS